MGEIKPCPRCGGKPEFYIHGLIGYFQRLKCKCGYAPTKYYYKEEDAIKAWNDAV